MKRVRRNMSSFDRILLLCPRTGRARALRNAGRPGLTSRCSGSILIPCRLCGTNTLSARSLIRRSMIAGQASKIPGVTCILKSSLQILLASSIVVVRYVKISSAKLVGSGVESSSGAVVSIGFDQGGTI